MIPVGVVIAVKFGFLFSMNTEGRRDIMKRMAVVCIFVISLLPATAEAGPVARMIKEGFESIFGKFGKETSESAARRSNKTRRARDDARSREIPGQSLLENAAQDALKQSADRYNQNGDRRLKRRLKPRRLAH